MFAATQPSAVTDTDDLQSVIDQILDIDAPIRLVAIDGPGGAGKSTFATRLAHAAGGAPIVHTDDFASASNPIDWWPRLLDQVIQPLVAGTTARYQRYDWPTDTMAEWHTVDPVPIVIIEGVSAGRAEWAQHLSFVIWIDTPRHIRLERGLARDGAHQLDQWRSWMASEDAHYQRDASRARADLVVPGATEVAGTEVLAGGWQSHVVRDTDLIRRNSNPWSTSVVDFLDHLQRERFAGSPRPIGSGFDDDGNELLEYLPGRSIQPKPWSDRGIVELGSMLGDFHRAAGTYRAPSTARWNECLARRLGEPTNGFGHGDLGPWNIMAIHGSPVGFIDWDTAGPLDPLYEVAQAAWLNVQLHDDDVAEAAGLGTPNERAHQLRLFLDAYGLAHERRHGFVDKMVEIAIHDAASQAKEHSVSPASTSAHATDDYPVMWAIAWRTRAASWMLRHREVLETAILA